MSETRLPIASLPYATQQIDSEDIEAVERVLRSEWLTTGPEVEAFERELAAYCGAAHGVSVSSGTAALHTMMAACGIGPSDEVVVPAITFVATANAVVFQGAMPVVCDVDDETLLLDPAAVEDAMTDRTKAIVGVDYAGQPCDYEALGAIAKRRGVAVLADACHALGAEDGGRRTGILADATTFSFHPVKHITTGEGGMLVTSDESVAERGRRFRNHGLTLDHRERAERGSWRYEMASLGFNYRLTDVQSALGRSQLRKLDSWIGRRRALAARYDAAFEIVEDVRPLDVRDEIAHAYHLYVVRVPAQRRDDVFARMRADGIEVNVHYLPVHLHRFYRERFGMGPGRCPRAEQVCREILSLPMFPAMQDSDVDRVVDALSRALS